MIVESARRALRKSKRLIFEKFKRSVEAPQIDSSTLSVGLRTEAQTATTAQSSVEAAFPGQQVLIAESDSSEACLAAYHALERLRDYGAADAVLETALQAYPDNLALQYAHVTSAMALSDLKLVQQRWLRIDPAAAQVDETYLDLTKRVFLFLNTEIDAFRERVFSVLCAEPALNTPEWRPRIVDAINEMFYTPQSVNYHTIKTACDNLLRAHPEWMHDPAMRAILEVFFNLDLNEASAAETLLRFCQSADLRHIYPCFCGFDNRNTVLFNKLSSQIRIGFQTGHFSEPERYKILLLCSIINKELYSELKADPTLSKPAADSCSGPLGELTGARYSTAVVPHSENDLFRGILSKSKLQPLRSTGRLRIALCVSGQLRGYKRALSTWHRLGLAQHTVTPFVHAWRGIGRKYPLPSHSQRLFEGAFLDAYTRACETLGFEAVQVRYPQFFEHFLQSDQASVEELRDTYNTDYVILEDDTGPQFKNWDNNKKMSYKIWQAHQFALSSGIPFDLIIRLRPDKIISHGDTPDWPKLCTASRQERAVFADFGFDRHSHIGFIVGDQFAVGVPSVMNVYCSTYLQTELAAQLGHINQPQEHLPHKNFAFNCFNNGVEVRTVPGVTFGDPVDPDQVPLSTLKQLLLRDIGDRVQDSIDLNLIKACG